MPILDKSPNNFNNSNNNKNNEQKISFDVTKRITKDDISDCQKFIRLLQVINANVLKNYDILERIGSGSESVVFKVYNKKFKKILAMKVIIREKDEKRNFDELIISNKFKNNNIIKIYGIFEIKKNELDCIIMEYAKFGNIRDFQKNILNKRDLSEQLLCFFAFQILNGLKHCHKCKIAHLDIKPQNIIIDDYLTAKIIDFSVSLDYSKTNSNRIKLPFRGTNFYMAPEVIQSKTINVKDLNKVDLYSLGALLYRFSFNTYPYDLNSEDSNDYYKIYNKIENNTLTFDNKDNYYSKFFIDFLTKLLEKDINKRININEAMEHYWIKGAKILLDEKEKTYYCGNFLSNLITNHIMNYVKYINL